MDYKRKLYISDMDGTFLNNHKEVSDYSRRVVNALTDKGLHFSVATARSSASAVHILSGVNIDVPVVLMNGVVIYDINKLEYIKTVEISRQTADIIIGMLGEYDVAGFMYAVSGNGLVTYYEGLYTGAMNDFYNERVNKYYKSFEQTDSFLDKTPGNRIIYFTLIDDRDVLSIVNKAMEKLPDISTAFYKDNYSDELWYLEIFSEKASKRNAVGFIREYCGFDHIIGFGDNYNDIPFLEACDEFYAVSGAVEELKRKSSGVIGGNNEDGVARFIAEKEGLFKTSILQPEL